MDNIVCFYSRLPEQNFMSLAFGEYTVAHDIENCEQCSNRLSDRTDEYHIPDFALQDILKDIAKTINSLEAKE
jgi:hypothetical protein